ncbi:VOC family protein [Variovorax sp. dw_954]|uniref:VOC family protein n=1 Tax=Variovorax sp. dw_954 TaxID=2720078 RepID=UPI001BD682F6|nr:VOC family protein [Variovorax sp. dw_954]
MNELVDSVRGATVEPATAAISPARLAHVVLRTSKFDELMQWYQTVLCASVAYSDGRIAFLAYDDEHHRIALIEVPGLRDQPDGICGVHHIAFTYASLSDLVATYERLDGLGISPVWCVNHGPTTSMYYADPDGNQVELQIDNCATVEEAGAFFFTPDFATNPIGVDFNPAELARRFHAGEDEATIKTRPASGPRGVDGINLR